MNELIVLLPLTILIILAVSTRKMELSLIVACLAALVLLHKGNIVTGTLDSFYNVLSNESFQFCIIFLITFGIMMKLFQDSGGLQGFALLIKRFIRGPKSAMVFCWVMDVILFIDEYLNALTVSFSMRKITDDYGIPREHLAFHVNAMACSLCLAVPMTSWTAFIVNLISDHGMTYADYLKAVPTMFYPLFLVIQCLLLSLGLLPKLGTLGKAYARVDSGGPALIHEKNEKPLVDLGTFDDDNVSSPLFVLLPLAVVIAGSIYFGKNMLIGLILGIVCQSILYIPKKLMTINGFFDSLFSGASSMLPLLMVLFFGFLLNECNESLGLFDLVIRLAGSAIPGWLLPLVAFVLVGALVFATGSCWLIMLLTVPIFIPLSSELGANPVLVLSALLSGIGLGYSTCFYGDTIFLSAAGTEVSNMTIIRTSLPYAFIAAAISAAGYIALGFLM